MSFELHPVLRRDSHPVTELGFCTVRLINDNRFPWLILVPRLAGLRDLHEVPASRRLQLFSEIDRLSRYLTTRHGAEKINVAALGNQVPQLHVHVIARYRSDPAWPGPVWNTGSPTPYPAPARRRLIADLRDRLDTRAR